MIATIQTLLRALSAPDLSFATIGEARPILGPDGLPTLLRTTRFVETQIHWQGELWLLSMPLSSVAMLHIERIASAIKPLHTPFLTKYTILPQELIWHDRLNREQRCDMLLQHLPQGKSFAEALSSEPKEWLSKALDRLEKGLAELHFSHNNLKPKNLHWSGSNFIPLRYHDAKIDGIGDKESFEQLHKLIQTAPTSQIMCDKQAIYTTTDPIVGHKWRGNLFEGLISVEDESGWGFVDANNRQIIESQYLWVGDFREGRAEIETATGMGLIDRTGRYIIAPEYEIVDYHPAQSVVWVRKDQKWAIFDYLGKRLTEFGANYEI